jgi:protein-L-isoaspartate(D-aspartate) O-methyltransferase
LVFNGLIAVILPYMVFCVVIIKRKILNNQISINYKMESLKEMVDYLKDAGFITKKEVESAFLSIDRAFFVPEELKNYAYADVALPLKENVTISAPSVIARTIELSEIKNGSNVLEIGTGSGYSTALIKHIIKKGSLYSIEVDEFAFKYAKDKLEYLGIEATLIKADGKDVFIKEKFFDAIIVHAAFKLIYENWLKQLNDKGVIVGPYEKEAYMQYLIKYKDGNMFFDIPVLYVPLI